jgi:hypothetical protein
MAIGQRQMHGSLFQATSAVQSNANEVTRDFYHSSFLSVFDRKNEPMSELETLM